MTRVESLLADFRFSRQNAKTQEDKKIAESIFLDSYADAEIDDYLEKQEKEYERLCKQKGWDKEPVS